MVWIENVWDNSQIVDAETQSSLVEEYLCDLFKPFCKSSDDVDARQSIELGSSGPEDVLKAGERIELDRSETEVSIPLSMTKTGDVRLDLDAYGPGTDWGEKNAESAVLSIFIDGKPHSDVVLYAGSEESRYSLSLGEIPAGQHEITLRYADGKSSREASGVVIEAARLERVEPDSELEKWAARHAPILIGRGGLDNNHTDTPLAMFHDIERKAGGVYEITYGYVFSNEDGGTARNPALQQARYGRLTDMEPVFRVRLREDGTLLDRQYSAKGHFWRDFEGDLEGTHPVIRTKTSNNMVTDEFEYEPDEQLRFSLPTDHRVPLGAPLEDLMRRNQLWWEVQSKELFRENKIDQDGAGSKPGGDLLDHIGLWLRRHGPGKMPKMADPRTYAYLQFHAPSASEDSVEARVKLWGDDEWYSSTRGEGSAEVGRDGWSQTAVHLPHGTRPEDIEKVEFKAGSNGRVTRVGHMYMLDDEYHPVAIETDTYWHEKKHAAVPIENEPSILLSIEAARAVQDATAVRSS